MSIVIRTPETSGEWEAYYDLRYKVLRKPLGKPLGSERNEGDNTGIHFALYDGMKLMAIGRLDQAEKGISQVRFVAVQEEAQGKGYGKLIMNYIEQYSRDHGNAKMILHARDYAVEFYKQLGYSIVEKSHLLFGVLQHYLMEKTY